MKGYLNKIMPNWNIYFKSLKIITPFVEMVLSVATFAWHVVFIKEHQNLMGRGYSLASAKINK